MGPRIAYLAFEPFPSAKGSGTRIAELARCLAKKGELHLVTLPPRGAHDGVPSAHHHTVQLTEPNFLARALAFRDAAARTLEAIRPDIVHFRGVFEGQAALAYAERRSIPSVFEVNGLPSVELQYHYPAVSRAHELLSRLRTDERKLLEGASVVITQSETTRTYLHGRGLPATTPAVVIPNGADPERYSPAGPNEVPVVLYAGTLAPWQGVAELLMATRRCARARPVRLVLAGPARRRWERQLMRIVRRLKIGHAVELAGALDRGALAAMVSRADLCLAPLRKDVRNKAQGCSPIKLFEYMAAGRPVISTDLPCVREIVAPNRTGVLIPTPRPKALAESILALLEDSPRRNGLGTAARADVVAHATWDHRRQALSRAYDSVVKRA